MAGAHARRREPSSGYLWLVLVVVLAVALAVAATYVDSLEQMRGVVAGVAVLILVPAFLAWSGARRSARASAQAAQAHRSELALVRRELVALRELNLALTVELALMRQQFADYVMPVSAEPETVYPSLQLPLVRAAFGEQPAEPGWLDVAPSAAPAEVPPEVDVSGVEPKPARQVVDLAGAEARTQSVA